MYFYAESSEKKQIKNPKYLYEKYLYSTRKIY